MSAQQYRSLIALANVLLMVAIAWVGVRVFKGTPTSPGEMPTDFSPVRYAIQETGGNKNTLAAYQPISAMLDRPKEVPPPPPPPKPVERPEPSKAQFDRYSLLMANVDRDNPDASTVVLKSGGQELTLAKGDSFDGYQVDEIRIQGRGDAREAVVFILYRGKRHEIRLKPRSQRSSP